MNVQINEIDAKRKNPLKILLIPDKCLTSHTSLRVKKFVNADEIARGLSKIKDKTKIQTIGNSYE